MEICLKALSNLDCVSAGSWVLDSKFLKYMLR